MTSEEQIQQIIRKQEQAIQRKDINGAMMNYSSDVVSFDVVNTLQKTGIDACRERLTSWLSQFAGPFSYAVENLCVIAGDELTFCHSFNHVKGALTTGDEIDMR